MALNTNLESGQRLFVSFTLLFLFWILVSSSLDLQHILVGILAALMVSYSSSDLLVSKRGKIPSFRAVPILLSYLGHFVVELIIANIEVARIVLDPSLPISPAIIKFKSKLKGDYAKVIFANTITLTPGTLTMDLVDATFYVHTLTKEAAEDVTEWPLENILMRFENVA
jgi:multicomponent Na+:H+ antiporter subunit E